MVRLLLRVERDIQFFQNYQTLNRSVSRTKGFRATFNLRGPKWIIIGIKVTIL